MLGKTEFRAAGSDRPCAQFKCGLRIVLRPLPGNIIEQTLSRLSARAAHRELRGACRIRLAPLCNNRAERVLPGRSVGKFLRPIQSVLDVSGRELSGDRSHRVLLRFSGRQGRDVIGCRTRIALCPSGHDILHRAAVGLRLPANSGSKPVQPWDRSGPIVARYFRRRDRGPAPARGRSPSWKLPADPCSPTRRERSEWRCHDFGSGGRALTRRTPLARPGCPRSRRRPGGRCRVRRPGAIARRVARRSDGSLQAQREKIGQ